MFGRWLTLFLYIRKSAGIHFWPVQCTAPQNFQVGFHRQYPSLITTPSPTNILGFFSAEHQTIQGIIMLCYCCTRRYIKAAGMDAVDFFSYNANSRKYHCIAELLDISFTYVGLQTTVTSTIDFQLFVIVSFELLRSGWGYFILI